MRERVRREYVSTIERERREYVTTLEREGKTEAERENEKRVS